MSTLKVTETQDYKTVLGASKQALDVVAAFRKAVAETEGDANVDFAARREHVAVLRKLAVDKLNALQQEAQRAGRSLDARFSDVLRPAPKNDGQALLAETSKLRGAAHVRALLDQAPYGGRTEALKEELARAAKAGQRYILDAVRDELSSMVPDVSERAVVLKLLVTADSKFYTPQQQEASAERRAFESGVTYRATLALSQAKEILSLPITEEALIVGTEEGEVLTVEAQATIAPPVKLPSYADSAVNPANKSDDRLYGQPIGNVTQ